MYGPAEKFCYARLGDAILGEETIDDSERAQELRDLDQFLRMEGKWESKLRVAFFEALKKLEKAPHPYLKENGGEANLLVGAWKLYQKYRGLLEDVKRIENDEEVSGGMEEKREELEGIFASEFASAKVA